VTVPYAEYLAFEEAAEGRHELVDGEIFGMSGGTPRHARLQANVLGALYVGLTGRPCAAYGPDLRIHFSEEEASAYADALVVCGKLRCPERDPNAITNPTLVCEVLSPTTEAYDRGRKFERYRGLAALKEYVLVSQDRPLVEVFRREGDGSWSLRAYGAGARAPLASCDIHLDVNALYAGVFDDGEPVVEGG
jgi:Uma2 family endonuclease